MEPPPRHRTLSIQRAEVEIRSAAMAVKAFRVPWLAAKMMARRAKSLEERRSCQSKERRASSG